MCGELYVVMIWKGGGISLVPYGIVFVSIMTWTHIRDVSRQARRICVPTTVRLTNDVVEIQTSQGVHVRGWTSFVKTVATSEFWLLYTKKRYAIIIPRRAFLVAEQAEIDSFLGALSVTGAA